MIGAVYASAQNPPKITTTQIQNLIVDSTRINATGDTAYYYQNGVLIGTGAIAGGGGGGYWTQTGSDIYYNTGNVGIGTSSPAHTLHINRNVTNTSRALLIGDSPLYPTRNSVFDIGGTHSLNSEGGIAYITPVIQNTITDGVYNWVMRPRLDLQLNLTNFYQALNIAEIQTNGYTLTNFTNAFYRNDFIDSTGAVTNSTIVDVQSPRAVKASYIRPTNQYGFRIRNQGLSGITNSYGLYIDNQTGATNSYSAIFNGGNVGIGTTSPSAKLDVVGDVEIDGKLDLDATGNSVFIGEDAGDVDDGSDNYNVGVGYRALFSNTSGLQNTASGFESLRSNTLGSNNTANGYQALYSTTTGVNNTANGFQALYSNLTGSSNTANGIRALYSNITGFTNVALGREAGRYTSTGANNTDSDSSIYIGYDSRPLADAQTNQIVIGNNAVGLGSNSVVLGNSSITKTRLQGDVGIGTSSPSAKLEVVGDMIVDDSTLYVNADSNRVGIGTSTPSATLELSLKGHKSNLETNKKLVLSNDDTTYNAVTLLLNSKTKNSNLAFGKNDTAKVGMAYDNRGFFGIVNSVYAFQDFGFRLNDDGSLEYYDYPSSSTSFKILSNGYVGIGTSSPNEKLDVRGRIEVQETTDPSQAGSGLGTIYANSSNSKLYYRDDNGNNYDLTSTATTSDGSWTNSGAVTYLTDSGDKVGIGTSTPQGFLSIEKQFPNATTLGFTVSDPRYEGVFQVKTNSSSAFFPAFEGYGGTELGLPLGVVLIGSIDSSADVAATIPSYAVNTIQAREYDNFPNGFGPVENAPILAVNNFATNLLRVEADGDVIIPNGNVGIGTTSPSAPLEILAYTNKPSLKIGALNFQSFAVNNAFIADNLYYNSTNSRWEYSADGYGAAFYFGGGGFTIATEETLNSSGAGAAASPTVKYRMTKEGGFSFGSYANSNIKGADTLITPGPVGIGTTSPLIGLQVESGGCFGSSCADVLPLGSANVRALNLIASDAVMKIHRKTSNTLEATGLELIWGPDNDRIGTNNSYWDIFLEVRDNSVSTRSGKGDMVFRRRSQIGAGSDTDNLFTIWGTKGQIIAPGIKDTTTANSANVYVGADGMLYKYVSSSVRYKENILDWNASGLDIIKNLKPRTFTYKADYYGQPDKIMLGLIAEEVEEVSPFLVDYKKENGISEVENVRYANIVVPLVKAIQEQQAIIESQANEIEQLKSQIQLILSEIEQIKNN